jgi:hypothetical protein
MSIIGLPKLKNKLELPKVLYKAEAELDVKFAPRGKLRYEHFLEKPEKFYRSLEVDNASSS